MHLYRAAAHKTNEPARSLPTHTDSDFVVATPSTLSFSSHPPRAQVPDGAKTNGLAPTQAGQAQGGGQAGKVQQLRVRLEGFLSVLVSARCSEYLTESDVATALSWAVGVESLYNKAKDSTQGLALLNRILEGLQQGKGRCAVTGHMLGQARWLVFEALLCNHYLARPLHSLVCAKYEELGGEEGAQRLVQTLSTSIRQVALCNQLESISRVLAAAIQHTATQTVYPQAVGMGLRQLLQAQVKSTGRMDPHLLSQLESLLQASPEALPAVTAATLPPQSGMSENADGVGGLLAQWLVGFLECNPHVARVGYGCMGGDELMVRACDVHFALCRHYLSYLRDRTMDWVGTNRCGVVGRAPDKGADVDVLVDFVFGSVVEMGGGTEEEEGKRLRGQWLVAAKHSEGLGLVCVAMLIGLCDAMVE